MRKKLLTFLILLLLDIVFTNTNKTNKTKAIYEKDIHLKPKAVGERVKRALDDEDRPFWPNRGKKDTSQDAIVDVKENNGKAVKDLNKFRYSNEEPFWATRGKRDIASSENYPDYVENSFEHSKEICKDCLDILHTDAKNEMKGFIPFWGNRGKRDSSKILDDYAYKLASSELGKNHDNDPFWGNRGKRDDEPFWGTRGRRQDSEPFWGNRGRREDSEPFWGNRGRREDSDPFWGNRGKRKDIEPFWPSRGRRKDILKDSILNTLNNVGNEIENLSRLKRDDRLATLNSFWENQGRYSKLKYILNGSPRNENTIIPKLSDSRFKPSDPNTLHDSRIYAEQPYYILIERNSRSSAEEDPYYISRGKKHYTKYDIFQATRSRRAAIEEIVKSIRNDPYYIARGKKYDKDIPDCHQNNLLKVKELICAAIDLLTEDKDKPKREFNEKDRERRAILKKLTDRLQVDPYYVSRGKKINESASIGDSLTYFISDLAAKCT